MDVIGDIACAVIGASALPLIFTGLRLSLGVGWMVLADPRLE